MMDEENPTTRAAELVHELLSITPANDIDESTTLTDDLHTRGYQRKLCEELLDILTAERGTQHQHNPTTRDDEELHADSPSNASAGESFIRTSISEYNNTNRTPNAPYNETNIREALGGLSSSTTSQLASVLTTLLTHRVNAEYLLPGTQDAAANSEALAVPDDANDGSSAKSAMTISSLGMTAARLYVELIGRKGAWGAGMVDVGGISAISALVRRWCVECRGREPAGKSSTGNKTSAPVKKRSKSTKGTRRSVRISSAVSFMDEDGSQDGSMNDFNATFFVEDDSLEQSDKLTEHALILGGLHLAHRLGSVPLQMEYKNWSSEAIESYLDAVCTALGTTSALLAGCKNNGELAVLCQNAVTSLERALCISILPSKTWGDFVGDSPDQVVVAPLSKRSRSKKDTKSPKEEMAIKKRLKESAIYVLRGFLPIFSLKVELPNGQTGKLAAYETATSLLVRIISCVSEEIQLNANNQRGKLIRLSNACRDSQTPKRGLRKSISFAHTPAPGTNKSKSHELTPMDTLQPPSLKKSITPRRTRSAANAALNEGPTIHPLNSLVMGMLHKLFTSKGLERADARARVTSIGMSCLTNFPSLERAKLLNFIGEMCHSKVSSHRLLAIEMIGEVICTEWYWVDYCKMKNGMITPDVALDKSINSEESSPALLAALHGRLTDKSPMVRMRAAVSLGEVIRKASAAREERNRLVVNVENTPQPNESASSVAFIEELCKMGTSLVDSLRKRASTDDKATVRKASIVAWLEMLSLAHRERNENCVVSGLDISTLCALCNDSSVATRKAAAEALTNLVQANYNSEEYTAQGSALEMAWAHTVLPLVRDVELTCVTKSLEFFTSLVIEPIIENDNDPEDMLENSNSRHLVAWRILSKISLGSQEAGGSRNGTISLQTALQKLFINAGKDCKLLAKNLLKAVYEAGSFSLGFDRRHSDSFVSHHSKLHCDLFGSTIQPIRAGAWCLLDALTSCLMSGDSDKQSITHVSLGQAVRASSIDASFLALSLNKFRALINSDNVPCGKRASLVMASRDCLRVMAKMASFVPIDDATGCFSDLLNDFKSFRVTVDLIPSAVSALVALCKRLCADSGMDVFRECEQWITKLLSLCEHAIESSFSLLARQHGSREVEEKLTRILFLVGELTMVGFSSEDAPGKGAKQNLASEREPVRGLIVRPSSQLLQSIKLMLPNFMPMPESSEDAMVPTPTSIRAHAFVTLGKLCLRDETLAKECLNILARELHQNSPSDPAVQTNALMVMGDLCVRYTNLVDKYLPFMAACLQAGEVKYPEVGSESRLSITFNDKTGGYSLVKKNAILLLSSLVLQDYIKWRGLFVFRFLAAVADEDDEVSCLARTAIRGPLLEKQRNLLSSSFVESVFVFNSCKAHPIYATAASNGGAGYVEIDFERGLLEGSEGYHRRHEVYQMMLDNMSDEQKLKVTTDIVKRILGGAIETSGDLGIVCRLSPQARAKISDSRVDSATHVLRDAFAILSSPHIKVGRRVSEETDPDDEFVEGNNAKADQRNFNKERLLSKISRKHLMEIVIPVLCNLKSVLEASRSPLLKDLMQYLGYIFRSFKHEVAEHLANDPTLLQELEYDTRKFEKKQRESILNAEIVPDA
ncbi:hypothetical protein HJC23_009018 [Cyclotella cryptica]|uniref:Sister chromatid cohesion protein n=1 Tax=Cyclotella cryptica TaxID=29204 RepID=A0ABD3R0B8_9STRA|eukprot:CCRYP_000629-RA/>CCRYP_000629-RA protein AED:0.27 eAED:0.27 QI:0/-1/0/1/-1/1/1/0/1618